jgi:hypothetical protein
MDPGKWSRAVSGALLGLAGRSVGTACLIGPMCAVTVTSEPPCHLECADWSARNCPFLARPKMVRREDDEINNASVAEGAAGFAITRNPGVALVWVTHRGNYRLFKAGGGGTGYLFQLEAPDGVSWYCEGRPATRAEVAASIDSGLPLRGQRRRPDAVASSSVLRARPRTLSGA